MPTGTAYVTGLSTGEAVCGVTVVVDGLVVDVAEVVAGAAEVVVGAAVVVVVVVVVVMVVVVLDGTMRKLILPTSSCRREIWS